MEMCYDGALVMPSSYAVMDEEEMMYVEGGAYISADTCNAIAVVCCGVVVASSAVSDVVGVIAIASPELISKSTTVAIYVLCMAAKLYFGGASAFFWYASSKGGISVGWSGFHFGR